MTNELQTTSILSLFETTKEQRQTFAEDIVFRIENGDADPLKVHLQIRCMEELLATIKENTNYRNAVLDASEKMEGKSFQFHNAKFEIKEVGVKYDFSKCGDPIHANLTSIMEENKKLLKERETMLKTLPTKGMDIVDPSTGELVTIYPPSKTSTTSVAVTLK